MLVENVRHKIYKADSHPVVVHVFEIWPVTTREKHRFWVSENGAEVIICTRKDDVTGGCIQFAVRKLVM